MQSQNPITADGVTYDRLSVNLAVTSVYNAAGERDMSIAMRVIPTAITADGVKTLDAQSHQVCKGSLSSVRTADEVACVQSMTAALAQYIQSQGW